MISKFDLSKFSVFKIQYLTKVFSIRYNTICHRFEIPISALCIYICIQVYFRLSLETVDSGSNISLILYLLSIGDQDFGSCLRNHRGSNNDKFPVTTYSSVQSFDDRWRRRAINSHTDISPLYRHQLLRKRRPEYCSSRKSRSPLTLFLDNLADWLGFSFFSWRIISKTTMPCAFYFQRIWIHELHQQWGDQQQPVVH